MAAPISTCCCARTPTLRCMPLVCLSAAVEVTDLKRTSSRGLAIVGSNWCEHSDSRGGGLLRGAATPRLNHHSNQGVRGADLCLNIVKARRQELVPCLNWQENTGQLTVLNCGKHRFGANILGAHLAYVAGHAPSLV
eukprot:scaffold254618_cov15-Tisochrysis_lutea.AAC.1